MIKTLSTYLLEIPFTNPTTSVIATSYTLKLYVWEGSKSAVPALPIYTITKANPSVTNGTDKIDISRLVNDFFDFNFTLPVVYNTLQNGNNQAWVKWEILYSDTPTIVTITAINLAVKGYGFYKDGANPQLPSNRILIDNDEFKISYDSVFVLPILLSETVSLGNVKIQSFPSLSMDFTLTITATTNSNELVKYVFVKPTPGASQDKYIEVSFNGITKTLLLETECKYDPLDFVFQNRNGAIETMTFFKAKSEKIIIDKKSFKNDLDTQYNVNAKTKFDINSGFVSEDKNQNIKQMLLAERTWLIEGGFAYPIIIDTKNLDYKTRVNDKLINYKIDYSYAFDDIY